MINYQDPFKEIQSNQFSTGQTSDPNMQTSWMNGGFQPQTSQPAPAPQPSGYNPPSNINNGTAVNSAFSQPGGGFWNPQFPTSPAYGDRQFPTQPSVPTYQGGQVGQYMPQGYDQGKWNDPNKSDPKYDVGRILSKYPPTPQGLQQAAPELQKLGFRIEGKDKIVGPDGYPVDVGQGFSDVMAGKTQQGNWWWNPSNPGNFDPSTYNKGFTGSQGAGQQPQFLQGLMQQIQQMISQPGTRDPNFNWSNVGSGLQPGYDRSIEAPRFGFGNDTNMSQYGNPSQSFLGGANLSPIRYDQQGNKIS